MPIKYHLHKNHLPNAADSYRARVEYVRVVDLEGVLDRMVLQHSTITRADMLGVFEEFLGALLQLLLDGMRVVTPFGEFGMTIKGNLFGYLRSGQPPGVGNQRMGTFVRL